MTQLMSRILDAHPFDEPMRVQNKDHFNRIAFEDGQKAWFSIAQFTLPNNCVLSVRVPCYKTVEEVSAWRAGFSQETNDYLEFIRYNGIRSKAL